MVGFGGCEAYLNCYKESNGMYEIRYTLVENGAAGGGGGGDIEMVKKR